MNFAETCARSMYECMNGSYLPILTTQYKAKQNTDSKYMLTGRQGRNDRH